MSARTPRPPRKEADGWTAHLPSRSNEDNLSLDQIIRDADLIPLLPALAQLTGDLSLIGPEVLDGWRPADPGSGMPGVPSPVGQQRALTALQRLREHPLPAATLPDAGTLRRLMEFITGDIDGDYLPLLAQELGLPSSIVAEDSVAPVEEGCVSVAVIGAGMSGLAAARGLAQAGIPFVVFERNRDVGGVWLQNDYPGCRLDTNNFAYSYSFAQTPDWEQQYSPQKAIHKYFQTFADQQQIYPKIRFDTTVASASFDDETCTWLLGLRDADGTETFLRVNAVISAVGQLNRPSFPAIPGREGFAGTAFHTARWDHDIDLTERRVAVIGTGASGYQVVPSIADQVSSLFVFQRSAPWALPAPDYHKDIRPGLRWLFQHVPYYHSWYRFYQFWTAVEGMRKYAVIDPGWQEEGTVSALSSTLRKKLLAHLENQYVDRPDLLAKVVPDYPPYAKRMLRDNGVWARAMKQDHVELITDGIAEITEKGIRTVDGVERDVDVIIYGTGFEASNFLSWSK